MNVISRLTLEDFWKSHNQAKKSLMAWYNKATKEVWEIPKDIKDRYPKVSFLYNNVVIFNIKGNDYRLTVKVNYKRKLVFICHVGTHSDYDKIDPVKECEK